MSGVSILGCITVGTSVFYRKQYFVDRQSAINKSFNEPMLSVSAVAYTLVIDFPVY